VPATVPFMTSFLLFQLKKTNYNTTKHHKTHLISGANSVFRHRGAIIGLFINNSGSRVQHIFQALVGRNSLVFKTAVCKEMRGINDVKFVFYSFAIQEQNIKHDRQCTYNVTLRRARVIIVAVELLCYTLRVCL